MTYEDYYNDLKIDMERVVLAEDIEVTGKPKPRKGKFYFKSLLPYEDTSSPRTSPKPKPNNTNIKGDPPQPLPYEVSNYMELEIPIYIQMDFGFCEEFLTDIYFTDAPEKHFYPKYHHSMKNVKFKKFIIPKGTEFIVGGLIGSAKYEYLRIIGIWKK